MKEFDELISIVRRLRGKDGCPWDRAQGLHDLKRYLLEETYELVEGIEEKKTSVVKEELGDIFLILISITEIFKKKGKFTLQDVLRTIRKKLVSRHPHVFSFKNFNSKKEVLEYWIHNKAKQKKRKTIKERLPGSAPALLLAEIFLKERAYLESISGREKKRVASLLISKIIKEGYSLKQHGVRGLEEILLSLCELAHVHRVDLESLLRSRVVREAEGISYASTR
ncbi:MAG: hypothetical protein JSW40_07105 [Candidatus Omnitrophota bacterium]|nr:MAG: hypothetical protein JSW40_07105 [Candidatus Omnitrophota bacterium]